MKDFEYQLIEPFKNHIGEELTVIKARAINLGDMIAHQQETEGLTEDAASKVLFSRISGQSLETIGKFGFSDWIQLKISLWKFLKGYDREYEPEIIQDDKTFVIMLETPIDRGEKPRIDSIELKKMTLDDHLKSQSQGATDWMSDTYKARLYSQLSGISIDDLKKMSFPDYLRLEVHSSDFLLGAGTMQRILGRLPSFLPGIPVPA